MNLNMMQKSMGVHNQNRRNFNHEYYTKSNQNQHPKFLARA